ncbi:MAG: hypothetical protein ABI585_14735 [Betaproteobacteria bacterium]
MNVDLCTGLDREVAAHHDRNRVRPGALDDIGRQDREVAEDVEAREADRSDGGRERERTTVELRGVSVGVAGDRAGDGVDRDRRGAREAVERAEKHRSDARWVRGGRALHAGSIRKPTRAVTCRGTVCETCRPAYSADRAHVETSHASSIQ